MDNLMRPRSWFALAAIPVLALALLLAGCEEDTNGVDETDGLGTPTATEEPLAEGTAAVEQDDNGDDLGDLQVGNQVSVVSDVEEVTSPRLFRIGGDDVLGFFGDETLVIVPADVEVDQSLVSDGATVRVDGEVIEVSVDEIEMELGELDESEREQLEDFDGEKAIMASSVAAAE